MGKEWKIYNFLFDGYSIFVYWNVILNKASICVKQFYRINHVYTFWFWNFIGFFYFVKLKNVVFVFTFLSKQKYFSQISKQLWIWNQIVIKNIIKFKFSFLKIQDDKLNDDFKILIMPVLMRSLGAMVIGLFITKNSPRFIHEWYNFTTNIITLSIKIETHKLLTSI